VTLAEVEQPVVRTTQGTSSSAWLPSPWSGLFWFLGVEMLAYTSLRGIFFLAFRGSGGATSLADLAAAFWLGARFDLRLALLIALPLLPLTASWFRVRRIPALNLWRAWAVAAGGIVTLVYLFDFGHYDYLHERLDAAVLDELRSPREAAGMVWQSYPVIWGLLGLLAILWGWWLVAGRAARRAVRPCAMSARRRVGAWVVCSLLAVLGLYGNLSWYPLRWSQAFFGTNPFVSALASNPVLYFAETLMHRSRHPDRESVASHYDLLADLLEVDSRDPQALSFTRHVVPDHRPAFAPNLVVIHLESWAAFQTGVLGNPLASSPNFDALARESLLFTHFFVPTGPTARSVFSMLTGIPDVPANNPHDSASRDPGVVQQPILIDQLAGYERHYFLGGSANWANIRALLAGSISDLHIHEEGSYGGERVDVWGISDLDLFEEAIDTFDAARGPFVAFIQTSGNHAPYTIPARGEGFEAARLDDETLQHSGFKSLDAYNGFRFLDHAVGRFIALAKERPWYRNTVFALYGDHGVPSVNGVPYEQIGLVRHHVPLVIHSASLIPEGRRIDYPGSSVDILPTCFTLMGVPYEYRALGRDLLAPRPLERRFAFLTNGLVLGDWFLRREEDGRSSLYRYASSAPLDDHAPSETETVQELATLYRAIEDWALWMEHAQPGAAPARR
jgi:phosphoglycerol transferase MdoB-like AlkP superfamily enzyme